MRTCAHCGQPSRCLTLGRCATCYFYRWRTGRDRPPHLLDPRYRFPCRVCGGAAARQRRGWCNGCYQRAWLARQRSA